MCDIYAMVGSLCGCASIWTMTAIALDRYNVIVKVYMHMYTYINKYVNNYKKNNMIRMWNILRGCPEHLLPSKDP